MEGFRRFVESWTIRVAGHEPEEKTQSLDDVCNFLQRRIIDPLVRKLPPEEARSLSHDTIAIDGSDVHSPTGTINFYTRDLSPQTVQNILNAILYYLHEVHATVGPVTRDTHEDYVDKRVEAIRSQGDDDPSEPGYSTQFPARTAAQKADDWRKSYGEKSGLRVVRIPVLSRHSPPGPDDPPEMNIADGSVDILFHQLLNYPQGQRTFSSHDVLVKLGHLTDFQVAQSVDPGGEDGGGGRATVIRGGYSEERIRSLVARLEAVCRWAVDHGFDTIEGD